MNSVNSAPNGQNNGHIQFYYSLNRSIDDEVVEYACILFINYAIQQPKDRMNNAFLHRIEYDVIDWFEKSV